MLSRTFGDDADVPQLEQNIARPFMAISGKSLDYLPVILYLYATIREKKIARLSEHG